MLDLKLKSKEHHSITKYLPLFINPKIQPHPSITTATTIFSNVLLPKLSTVLASAQCVNVAFFTVTSTFFTFLLFHTTPTRQSSRRKKNKLHIPKNYNCYNSRIASNSFHNLFSNRHISQILEFDHRFISIRNYLHLSKSYAILTTLMRPITFTRLYFIFLNYLIL